MTAAKRRILVFCFIFLLGGGALAQDSKPLRNDVKWMTQSVEYAALCRQTYRLAWQVLKRRAAAETRDWVAVFDVDETVLDNSPYAQERTAIDSGFTRQSWWAWVRREAARPIPGAKAFIDSVRSLGPKAHVAFITNRSIVNEKQTIANLRKEGLYREGDLVLCKAGREDRKLDRRKCVETGTGRCEGAGPLVILALFGDNIRDFMPMRSMETARRYKEKELPYDENWGEKYFILPNPNYGSWERDYR